MFSDSVISFVTVLLILHWLILFTLGRAMLIGTNFSAFAGLHLQNRQVMF